MQGNHSVVKNNLFDFALLKLQSYQSTQMYTTRDDTCCTQI